MNKYCLLLNKKFLNVILELNNISDETKKHYNYDHFKTNLKNDLKNTNGFILIDEKYNCSNVSYKDIFKHEIHKIIIENLDKPIINKDDISVKIECVDYNLYILKYGINKYIVFKNDNKYAKIPLKSYMNFKNNYSTNNFDISNSKNMIDLKNTILSRIKNNKIILNDKTVLKYDENNLDIQIEDNNILMKYTVERPGGIFQYDLIYLIDNSNELKIRNKVDNNLLFGNLIR